MIYQKSCERKNRDERDKNHRHNTNKSEYMVYV